jgi:hypothetical protein
MTAQEFLSDFTKDIIKDPMERQALIAGYAKHLEAMLEAARKEGREENSGQEKV